MSFTDSDIAHRKIEATPAATIRVNLKQRAELRSLLAEVARAVPPDAIAGPALAVFTFVTSYPEGFDVELGFPVSRPVANGNVQSRILPALQVLSLSNHGDIEGLRDGWRRLYQYARQHGLISDEFRREVYPDWHHPEKDIELQFVIHDWPGILEGHLRRVAGREVATQVVQGRDALTVEATLEERFLWTRGAMERLDCLADDYQRYDAVSSCAHVFPQGQLDKLRTAYKAAHAATGDPLQAVDAVLAFMRQDPCWPDREVAREGHTIFDTKLPADPEAHARARTATEKRAAACYCPIVRTNLDRGMPITFCYCGAGWFRQQWEAATGRPVRVEVVQSVLKGDDACRFAIHLAEDL